MTKYFRSFVAAGLMLTAGTAALAPVAASAQTVEKGIAVVDVNEVLRSSSANQTAQRDRPTAYQAVIDQRNQAASALNAQLNPLYDEFEALQAANDNVERQRVLYSQIQQITAAGEQQLNQITQPIDLSRAYVQEQIVAQIETAIQQAAAERRVSLVLTPGQVLYNTPDYDMTQATIAKLNALIPVAQLTPPQGWLPAQVRQQLAIQQALQQAQAQANGEQGQQAAPAQAPVQQPGEQQPYAGERPR